MKGKFCTGKRCRCDMNKTQYQQEDIHTVTWRSPDYTTHNQTDHTMVDRRQSTNVCDVRSIRHAEPETDHFLGNAKITLKIMRVRRLRIVKYEMNISKLKRLVKEFSKEVLANVQNIQLEAAEAINEIYI